MTNNLFEQIEQWDISTNLSIKNISEEELAEAKDKLTRENDLSTKQLAVVNDILGMRNKEEKYYICAQKHYSTHIRDLIGIFIGAMKNDTPLEYMTILGDINASFIRCFIYKKANKANKAIWDETTSNIYNFIQDYDYNHNYIILNDTIICFLLLTDDNKQFQEQNEKVLSIYFKVLLKRNDYNLLEWIFNKNTYFPIFNPDHLFNKTDGQNNLKNIIQNTQTRIKNSDKFYLLKKMARNNFLSREEEGRNINKGLCIPFPPNWIIKHILTNDDKNTLKAYYKNMNPSFSEEGQFNIRLGTESVSILEQIKNSNSLEEIIKLIISMNRDEFIENNMDTCDYLTGAGMPITQLIKSVTGEVEPNSTDKIEHSKLNVLYYKMFDAIPDKCTTQQEIENLIKQWSIIKTDFYEILTLYLASILGSSTLDWQKKANINQIVLLIESILASLDPDEYTALTNGKNGYSELTGKKWAEFINNSLLKNNNSSEKQFLLKEFRDHRNRVAHGKTFEDSGNCYFILVGIMKVFYMKLSDFNLSKE